MPASDGRRIWLGWMSNWAYAQAVPTSPWRSAMTVPRTLGLRRTPEGLRLVQEPVAELGTLRAPSPRRFAGGSFAGAASWLASQAGLPPLLEIEMRFTGVAGTAPFDIHLDTGPDERTTLIVDPARQQLVLDRTRSGLTGFHRAFAARHTAPLRVADGMVTLRLLLDTSSIEVFAQGGETTITDLIFPAGGARSLRLASGGETPDVDSITLYALTNR